MTTTPASPLRIRPADLDNPSGRLVTLVSRRLYGEVLDGVYVMAHHRKLMWAVAGFERKVQRWHELDPQLKAFAVMASAAEIGCSWCLDFAYFLAHTDGLDETKAREVPRWRQSSLFTDLERDVMEYAEAMTATPPTVTDEMVTSLVERLGEPGLVELTQMVALENMRSRVNAAMGLRSQGFSAACELPLTVPSGS
ncbi:MAG: carboxymuconolactone decarboxylase family protein [Nocardioidaceae bacterium]|nr:carboxymuconolactone decarboxylase family protein [Nocardioidaceae bacterium]